MTDAGTQVHLRPVSRRLIFGITAACRREAEARGEPLSPPTYTVETVGGGTETFAHDAKSIEAEGTSEAERAAWSEHQAALARLEAEVQERVTRVLLLEGLDVPQVPEEWQARMRRYGLQLETDPDDLKLQYITTELLRTSHSLLEAVAQITLLSMRGSVPEEDIAATEASFRRALRTAGIGGSGSRAKPVDGKPASGGAAGGEELGPAPKRVGRARRR